MANETKLTVMFGSGGGNEEPKTTLITNIKPATQINDKALLKGIIAGIGLQTFSREVSVRGQLTGNAIEQNKINVAMGLATSVYSLGVAFATNPALGAVLLSSKAIGILQDQRNIMVSLEKNEVSNNNMRQLVGLEATNYSRYNGKRR